MTNKFKKYIYIFFINKYHVNLLTIFWLTKTDMLIMGKHCTCWNDSHSCHWPLVVLPSCHYQV